MKSLKFKLKFAKKISILFFVFTIVSVAAVCQSFDKNIEVLSKLYLSQKYTELNAKLSGMKSSSELSDLKLFLEAEALKNIGRKAEALKLYSQIMEKFPGSEMAFQSSMPHFMLQLENADEASVSRLEVLAGSLFTPWQKGTAFEKLQGLSFLHVAQKSRFALLALQGYADNKSFYNTAPASAGLLKKILLEPAQYAFTDDEWVEILLFASSEGLIGEFFKKGSSQAVYLGKYGQSAVDLFRAEWLRHQKKLPAAMQLYDAVIASKKSLPSIIALARQLRGDANHFAEKYAMAVSDYKEALKYPGFPVNENAGLYRMMRSAYRLGNDAECLELLNRLVKKDTLGTLFPVHIYEMGLEHFDKDQKSRSVPYFMLLAKNFPGHYRADDALGYAAMAVGAKSKEGQVLLALLKKKYPNSFFIYWVAPEAKNTPLKPLNPPLKKLNKELQLRLAAMKKLWSSGFANFARAEAIKLTDKNPGDLALYKGIIDIAMANHDYNQVVAFGERLSRQILESGRALSDMPEWGWKALYPLTYESMVRSNARQFGIDPYWILSIMREESHFKEDTLSRSNAMSLMQILPTTGKWIATKLGEKKFHTNNLWEPSLNIRYGSWYLKYLADLFNGDLFLASASYNGGQGNIQRKVEAGPYSNMPVLERLDKVPLPETRDYYKKVMGSHWNYSRLYSPMH